MDELDISIILPALNCNDELMRCVYSLRTAFNCGTLYEIILVVPNPIQFDQLKDIGNIRIYSEEVPGIYGAMNTGIAKATGKFLYFIGQDDILLPSAAEALHRGITNNADLILANVYWGNSIIYKNYLSLGFLSWKNWCHQGVFYRRLSFLSSVERYPVEFKAQADHYVNIIICSQKTTIIERYTNCVAWYSAEGFSTRSPDFVFRAKFPQIVLRRIGFLFYLAVVIRRGLLRLLPQRLRAFKN